MRSASCESGRANILERVPPTELTQIDESSSSLSVPTCLSLQLIIICLEFHVSHADICHIQSFIFLMSRHTKQSRHTIRFLSTLFLPAVCHHKQLEFTDTDAVVFLFLLDFIPGHVFLANSKNMFKHETGLLLTISGLQWDRGQNLHKEFLWKLLVAQLAEA